MVSMTIDSLNSLCTSWIAQVQSQWIPLWLVFPGIFIFSKHFSWTVGKPQFSFFLLFVFPRVGVQVWKKRKKKLNGQNKRCTPKSVSCNYRVISALKWGLFLISQGLKTGLCFHFNSICTRIITWGYEGWIITKQIFSGCSESTKKKKRKDGSICEVHMHSSEVHGKCISSVPSWVLWFATGGWWRRLLWPCPWRFSPNEHIFNPCNYSRRFFNFRLFTKPQGLVYL